MPKRYFFYKINRRERQLVFFFRVCFQLLSINPIYIYLVGAALSGRPPPKRTPPPTPRHTCRPSFPAKAPPPFPRPRRRRSSRRLRTRLTGSRRRCGRRPGLPRRRSTRGSPTRPPRRACRRRRGSPRCPSRAWPAKPGARPEGIRQAETSFIFFQLRVLPVLIHFSFIALSCCTFLMLGNAI